MGLLKPVFWRSQVPHVKVSDFGLARMKEASEEASEEDWGRMTMAQGTNNWMAPEVVKGTHYNEKVDIYSYAMVLWEIICRDIPLGDKDPGLVVHLVAQKVRPNTELVPLDCPESLSKLMTECWEHDPAD